MRRRGTRFSSSSDEVAGSRCSRRRAAGGDGGTTLFRFVSSDEDGGNRRTSQRAERAINRARSARSEAEQSNTVGSADDQIAQCRRGACGRHGTRIGLGIPKQLIKIAGKPIIEHRGDAAVSTG